MKPEPPGKGIARIRVFSRSTPERKSPEDSLWRKLFKDSDISDRDIYIMNLTVSFLLLVIVVFLADLAARTLYEDPNSLHTMQKFETWTIATVQHDLLGVDVEVYNGTYLDYDVDQDYHGYTLSQDEKIGGVLWEVSSTCSGLHEMVFLSVLIAGFPGVELRKRFTWAGIMAGVLFVENLFRIGILFFLAWMIGRDFEGKFHYQFWHFGQYVVMMSLFVAWFYFVAWKDIDRKMEEKDRGDSNSEKEDEEGGKEGEEDVGEKEEDEEGDKVREEDVGEKEEDEEGDKVREEEVGEKEEDEEGDKEREEDVGKEGKEGKLQGDAAIKEDAQQRSA